MKFNEITENQWAQMKPYFDTCLLPVTGLSGMEQPWEATKSLEKLRELMDLLEIPFKGRMVTYPAFHFISNDAHIWNSVETVCDRLKQENFAYVIVVTCLPEENHLNCPSADLWITPDGESDLTVVKSSIALKVRELWNAKERAETER